MGLLNKMPWIFWVGAWVSKLRTRRSTN